MFNCEVVGEAEFKSSWEKERSVKESGCQTQPVKLKEVGHQTTLFMNQEVQTEDEEVNVFQLVEDNSPALVEFLHRVEPLVSYNLEKNSQSHAFDGYDVNWTEEVSSLTCLHTFSNPGFNEEMVCTGLSWNCTGMVLSASFGKLDHQDWCCHKAALCFWNVERRHDKDTKPDTVIDLPNCLMCVAFHPIQPSVIAGGLFNGEIMIWDTNKEDMLITSSGLEDDSHREGLAKLLWIPDKESRNPSKKYKLVSIAGDGKILIWKMINQKLKLIDGFILLMESVPRSSRPPGVSLNKEVGVTSISFNCEDESTFIIGSEGGGIFRCSTNTRGTPADSNIKSSIPLHSPVNLTFSSHAGPVYSVECSPYHRSIFLTCGLDYEARIYNILQPSPLHSISPGHDYMLVGRWSPVRPLVFVLGTSSGNLLIYDLKVHRSSATHTLEASSKKKAIHALEFNLKQPKLLASGDALGYIQVWQLSEDLFSPQARESELLNKLAALSLEEDASKPLLSLERK